MIGVLSAVFALTWVGVSKPAVDPEGAVSPPSVVATSAVPAHQRFVPTVSPTPWEPLPLPGAPIASLALPASDAVPPPPLLAAIEPTASTPGWAATLPVSRPVVRRRPRPRPRPDVVTVVDDSGLGRIRTRSS